MSKSPSPSRSGGVNPVLQILLRKYAEDYKADEVVARAMRSAADEIDRLNKWADSMTDSVLKERANADALIKELQSGEQLRTHRQALWDIYGILGFDQDGDKTPDALAYPGLIELVVEAAKEARRDYDEALKSIPSETSPQLTQLDAKSLIEACEASEETISSELWDKLERIANGK
jgi:hypothetical protein